ncbi:hypothetical protein ASG17_13860 [Brevundimonas sp. Leaf363]|nr:hypothetical protein ASG17_13860 [Brevundimonas sp. Leaf363]
MKDIDVIGWSDGAAEGLAAGWRVNLTPETIAIAPGLATYVVRPGRLVRVWAGDDPDAPTQTIALWFETAAAADAVLAPYAPGEEM